MPAALTGAAVASGAVRADAVGSFPIGCGAQEPGGRGGEEGRPRRPARRTVVAADGGKLGRTAFAHVGPAALLHTLVTDTSAPAGEVAALESAGTRVKAV